MSSPLCHMAFYCLIIYFLDRLWKRPRLPFSSSLAKSKTSRTRQRNLSKWYVVHSHAQTHAQAYRWHVEAEVWPTEETQPPSLISEESASGCEETHRNNYIWKQWLFPPFQFVCLEPAVPPRYSLCSDAFFSMLPKKTTKIFTFLIYKVSQQQLDKDL